MKEESYFEKEYETNFINITENDFDPNYHTVQKEFDNFFNAKSCLKGKNVNKVEQISNRVSKLNLNVDKSNDE